MVSPRLKSDEMLVGIIFICLLTTIMCSIITINNLHLYSRYQQIKLEADTFSLVIQCHIVKIVSREVTSPFQQHSSWTSVESRFLISILHPQNNTRKLFEEESVPLAIFNTVVSPHPVAQLVPLPQSSSRSIVPTRAMSILRTTNTNR